MEKIQIIGASTLVGQHFIDSNSQYNLQCFTSKKDKINYLNVKDLNSFSKYSFNNSLVISFAPIWITSEFLNNLEKLNPDNLSCLKGIIAYSSTSVITKRFSVNNFDQKLYNKLKSSEENINCLCKKYSVNLVIVRPTMIYGEYKGKKDKNISLIYQFLKKSPVCFFPIKSGYRQPIHYSQLSKITFYLINDFFNNIEEVSMKTLDIGGDEVIEYKEILFKINNNLLLNFKRNCKIILVPNYLFYIFISPLLLFNSKVFEALFRVGSNLSGFKKCSIYIGEKIKKFPIDLYKL